MRVLAQLELPGQHRPDPGESGTQSSSCDSRGSSTEAEGVPDVGEVVNLSLFLYDGSLGRIHNDQTVVNHKILVT